MSFSYMSEESPEIVRGVLSNLAWAFEPESRF